MKVASSGPSYSIVPVSTSTRPTQTPEDPKKGITPETLTRLLEPTFPGSSLETSVLAERSHGAAGAGAIKKWVKLISPSSRHRGGTLLSTSRGRAMFQPAFGDRAPADFGAPLWISQFTVPGG